MHTIFLSNSGYSIFEAIYIQLQAYGRIDSMLTMFLYIIYNTASLYLTPITDTYETPQKSRIALIDLVAAGDHERYLLVWV